MKGLKAEEIIKILHEPSVRLPLHIHFRVASIGGPHPELTHPFPILSECPTDLEGTSYANIMHNGHWPVYRKMLFWSTVSRGKVHPGGHLSDSRALAMLIAHHGYGLLDILPFDDIGKISLLTEDGLFRYGNGWIESKEGGFWHSASIDKFNRGGKVVDLSENWRRDYRESLNDA